MNATVKKLFSGNSEISDFFNSAGFIWIVAGLTYLFWILKWEFPGIAVLLLLAGLVAVFCEDATPSITCFTFMFFVLSDPEISFSGRELWCLFIIVPVAGFTYNLIRFRARGFFMGGFSLSILVCLLPWLFQGLGVSGRSPLRAFLCVGLGIVFCLFYFVFNIISRGKRKFTEYYATVMLAVGVLILLQILFHHYSQYDFKNFTIDDFLLRRHGHELGWGTSNPVATIFSLVMPITFYFSTKKYKFGFLFIILGYAEFFVILLMRSRGVALFATLAMPFLMGYSIIGAKNKIPNIIVNSVAIVAVAAVAIFKIEYISELYYRLLENKLDDNGRAPVWADGIGLFVKHPIFGGGFDYVSEAYFDVIGETEGPTFFHSTFIQIFASMGILGGICYAYLYYWRYRVAFTDMTGVKFTMLIGMVVFESFCFVDTVFFHPLGYFLMMIISMCMEKDLQKDQITPLVVTAVEKFKAEKSAA